MRQKTIVGLIMAAGAALMIAVGGWVMALIVLVLIIEWISSRIRVKLARG